MEFTNAATKAAFKPLTAKDRKVHVPRGEGHSEYSGPMSKIPPAVAQTMINQGVPYLEKITTNPPKAVIPEGKKPE